MPMIDVYADAGTLADKHKLAQNLAKAVMKWENVPPINLMLITELQKAVGKSIVTQTRARKFSPQPVQS